ncbi:MAG: hypothetical protein HFJ33_07060 [Clostridia bacterium]|nr:hypothetical protein [Clostridia bacterium]
MKSNIYHGEEEYLRELKSETDTIILGQHFIYDQNKKLKCLGNDEFSDTDLYEYAKYIEKAMELGLPEIIAHPDFFMKNSRKSFEEVEQKVANMICRASEKYEIPLEINLNNIYNNTYYENQQHNNDSIEKQKEKLKNVVYPNKKFWEIATNYHIKVVYGIDTHHRGQILQWNELIKLVHELLGKETIEKLKFVEK